VRAGIPLSGVLMLHVIMAGTAGAQPVHDTPQTYLGASIGMPTFLGAVLETKVGNNTWLGFHAGTMLLINSAGARFIFGSTDPGWRFRYFLGAVIISKWYSEYADEADGTAGHGWCGINMTLNEGSWRFVLETGLLVGGDPGKGMGYTGVTPSLCVSLQHSL